MDKGREWKRHEEDGDGEVVVVVVDGREWRGWGREEGKEGRLEG